MTHLAYLTIINTHSGLVSVPVWCRERREECPVCWRKWMKCSSHQSRALAPPPASSVCLYFSLLACKENRHTSKGATPLLLLLLLNLLLPRLSFFSLFSFHSENSASHRDHPTESSLFLRFVPHSPSISILVCYFTKEEKPHAHGGSVHVDVHVC